MLENYINYWHLGIFILIALAYFLGTKKAVKNIEEKICGGIDEHSGFKKLCERFDKLDNALFTLKGQVKENTNFKEENKYIRLELDKKIKEIGKMEITPENNEDIQLLKEEIKKLKKQIKKLSLAKDKERMKNM